MITAKPQSYADGDTELAGELFVDTSAPSERRPGVMLVHGGAGLDDHARQQARRYAELGYVVLACDMFGRDIAGGRREQIIALLTGMRDDPDRLVRRARAGLDLLSRVQAIDERMAVVGFCFGGLAALQLARSGAPIAAAVSIQAIPWRHPIVPGRCPSCSAGGSRDPGEDRGRTGDLGPCRPGPTPAEPPRGSATVKITQGKGNPKGNRNRAVTAEGNKLENAGRREPEEGGRRGRTRRANGKPEESPRGKPEDVR